MEIKLNHNPLKYNSTNPFKKVRQLLNSHSRCENDDPFPELLRLLLELVVAHVLVAVAAKVSAECVEIAPQERVRVRPPEGAVGARVEEVEDVVGGVHDVADAKVDELRLCCFGVGFRPKHIVDCCFDNMVLLQIVLLVQHDVVAPDVAVDESGERGIRLPGWLDGLGKIAVLFHP